MEDTIKCVAAVLAGFVFIGVPHRHGCDPRAARIGYLAPWSNHRLLYHGMTRAARR